MDDVDAVQAQIARNMLTSGDRVTARLDGVAYLEKAPLVYWIIAIFYKIFGVHDWAARIPIALSVMALAWLTAAFGNWAFGKRAGLYAGLCMATCIGIFLFTRILIPDVMLTFTTTLAMWAFLRTLDEEEPHLRFWAFVMAASLGVGLLLKSLVGVVFPVAGALIYLFLTKQLFALRTWQRLRPISGFFIVLLIAAPWHILATLRNPPYFSLSFHSGPGEYHGFLWFYFINEQFLRFLNLRYPRDYNTVPRLWFWLFHFLWLFPWSVYFPAIVKLSYKPVDRAGRARLLALCWTGFLLIFFTFSTTQEYYSMPCYPALALLLGSAMAAGGDWIRRGTRVLCGIAGVAAIACFAIFVAVRNLPTPGDISGALSRHPSAYTLSMMVLFFHAARLALVVFDPYLTSRPLAQSILQSAPGKLIVDRPYYAFSSLIFYTNSDAMILNGRYNNLEYGSYAPGAPNVFIDDARFRSLWLDSQRYYLVAYPKELSRFENLVGREHLNLVASSGGKLVFTNQPLDHTGLPPGMHYLSAASKNALAIPPLYR